MSIAYSVKTYNRKGKIIRELIIPYHKPKLKPLSKVKTDNATWSNSDRQSYLVQLWKKYGNKCLLGHPAYPILSHYIHYDSHQIEVRGSPKFQIEVFPNSHGQSYFTPQYAIVKDNVKTKEMDRLYELKSENLIQDWISLDRSNHLADYQAEKEARHTKMNDMSSGILKFYNGRLHKKFSPIDSEIFFDNQTAFYVEALGVNGLNFHPFAKVRLASSNTYLYVDLFDVFKSLSHRQKRKAIRYGKVDYALQSKIDTACFKAVEQFLKRN